MTSTTLHRILARARRAKARAIARLGADIMFVCWVIALCIASPITDLPTATRILMNVGAVAVLVTGLYEFVVWLRTRKVLRK